MRFCVLGSGSGGNATFIEAGGGRILVDAGFSAAELERRLNLIDETLGDLDAIVVTHEHGDHTKGLVLAALRANCPVLVTEETAKHIKWKEGREVDVQTLHVGKPQDCGLFTVRVERVPHDAAEPLAVRVSTEKASIVIATDQGAVTDGLRKLCERADAIVLESNHDTYLLDAAPYNDFTKERIRSNRGHLSNDQAAEFLRSDFDGYASHIVLAHLSSKANMPAVAEKAAKAALRDIGLEGLVTLAVATQDKPTPIFTLSV